LTASVVQIWVTAVDAAVNDANHHLLVYRKARYVNHHCSAAAGAQCLNSGHAS
jgi:hypothetical protein